MKGLLVILAAVFLLCGLNIAAANDDANISGSSTDSTITKPDTTQIVVYYFFQTQRCPSCKKIEAYTDEAVNNGFADLIESGFISWQPINVDDDGNSHYMDDYELFTKSVILSRVVNGKEVEWVNLQKVWELLNDKDKFIKYIDTEIRNFAGIE